MSDRILHAEPPLSEAEHVGRFNPKTKIAIEHSSEGVHIRRDWVRDSAADDSPYGYAEKRERFTQRESKLEMELPGVLDVAALTTAILEEVRRQRERATS